MPAWPWLSSPNLAPAPLAVAVWVIISVAAETLGMTVLKLFRFPDFGRALRFLVATGLGYVLLAYGILALGLLHHLQVAYLGGLILLCVVLGLGAEAPFPPMAMQAAGRLLSALWRSPRRLLYAVILIWLLLTFFAALGPSDSRDWDGLSEHLAQAKTYLRDGRVEPLWYDHHSEFPSTMVMLYTAGLAFGGQGAAKLFHWGFGLMTLLAAWSLARRHLSPRAGPTTIWVLATTPILGWLATIGYVDFAEIFFCVVAVDLLLTWRRDGRAADLYLAGAVAGCGMAVKMQGLFTLAVLGFVVIFWTIRLRRRLAPVFAAAAIALVISCPWYIKSWLVTGNPFYPFGYAIFGGKQWSLPQARVYAYHHATFGYGKLPPENEWQAQPAWRKRLMGSRSPLMLLIAPFALTFLPQYYEPRQPAFIAMLKLSLGPMYLALCVLPFVLPRPRAPAAFWLAGIFVLFWIVWLESTQLVRYLLPWLALIAPLAGLALADLLDSPGPARAVASTVAAVWSIVALSFLGVQAWPLAQTTLGVVPADIYLRQYLDVYEPLDFLNHATPPSARIGTYGEPRLFYLDRDRLWADPGHSLLIDYDAATTPARLISEYRRLGLTHILINQQFFGSLATSTDDLHRLLSQTVQQGLLVPVSEFGRGHFLLFRVASP
jgi:hypothetical protein